MGYDRPVASVSGADGWQWNQWQRERRAQVSQSGFKTTQRSRQVVPETGRRTGSPSNTVDTRTHRAELEHTQERLERVISRYEWLLAERNRKLTEAQREQNDQSCLHEAVADCIQRISERF